MVNNVNSGYQPTQAYQPSGSNADPQVVERQRTDQIQRRDAPAADSQRSEQRTLASRDDSPPPRQTDSRQQKGSIVDLSV